MLISTMNSKEIKYLTEAYSNVYSEPETDCQELYDSFLDLCILDGGFTTLEECEDFAESLVADNLVEDFIVSLLEYYEVENLNESFEFLGENRAAALRSVINALSSGGRLKAGLKPLSALGRRPETVVKGAAARASIRSARTQRTPTPTQEPGKYLRLLQQKRTPKPLSPQGQEINDYNKMMGGGGVFSSKPGTSGRGAPGIGNPIQKAIDFGRRSKETQRLALRAQRMAKNNYGKLLNTPLGKAAATLATAAGLGIAGSGKKTTDSKSSINKYNTKDSDGTVRDRLKVGPKIVGPKIVGPKIVGTGSVAGDFDAAYKKAKTSGKNKFEFKGKNYTTESLDYFDIVVEHLIEDGYVNNYEDALTMMSALDENAIARIAALSEQKYRIINKDGTETISDTPAFKGSGAASTVKPIGTKYSYKDGNPYRPRSGESD